MTCNDLRSILSLVYLFVGLLVAVLLFGLLIVWNRRILVTTRTRGVALPAIIAPLALPYCIPSHWVYARVLVTTVAVVMACKAYELLRDRVPDPRMLDNLGTFCFWLLIPPKSTLPSDDPQVIIRTRAEGLRRLRRVLFKLPGVIALTLLHLHWPPVHSNRWVEAFWALWLTYWAVSSVIDILTGLAMQTGISVCEGFNAPPLARSPRDFWGRRWNLIVHDLLFRHIFLPMGGLRRPLKATLAVFFVSGLAHELSILMMLGHPSRYTGWMLLFFGLHGSAVILQLWWDRGFGRRRALPRPLAIMAHLVWFTLTAPLFFAPLGEIFSQAWPN